MASPIRQFDTPEEKASWYAEIDRRAADLRARGIRFEYPDGWNLFDAEIERIKRETVATPLPAQAEAAE